MLCGVVLVGEQHRAAVAATALRSICSAIAVLPRPCGPPSRTSSPERKPPVRATSRASKPVGQTRAPAVWPWRSFSSVSTRTSASDRSRPVLRDCLVGSPVMDTTLAPAGSALVMRQIEPSMCIRWKRFGQLWHRTDDPGSAVTGQSRHTWSRGTPRCPRSRPRGRSPDALTPPNGAAGLEMIPWLMPIIPYSSASLTRITRLRSFVKT